jgi:hypothetical protein
MLEQKQFKHGEILHAWGGGNSRLGRANLHISRTGFNMLLSVGELSAFQAQAFKRHGLAN